MPSLKCNATMALTFILEADFDRYVVNRKQDVVSTIFWINGIYEIKEK